MRRPSLLPLALLAGLALGRSGAAWAAPTLRVTLQPPTAEVGDLVVATLELRGSPAELGGAPRFPAWGKTWGDAEVRAVAPPQRTAEGDAVVYRQRVTLAAFKTGRLALPAVAVGIPSSPGEQRLSTPAGLALEIRSVLPAAGSTPAPKPAAPPRPLPWGKRFFWALGAGLLGLVLALIAARRPRRAGAGAASNPALPALEELEATLARLRADAGKLPAVALHTDLSLALRRFLARSAGVPALESTSSEIDHELRRRALPREPCRSLVRLLRDCDRVKFARTDAAQAAAIERLAAALAAGRAIDQHQRPPAAEAPA
ncbi:MAG: hypothetical protein ACM3OB_07580 [Acidobacteriota bacterium]